MSKRKLLMRTLGLVCIMALLAIPISGCAVEPTPVTPAPEEASYTLKLAHALPADSFIGEAMQDYGDRITALSNGRITFDIFPGGLLGDANVIRGQVSLGTVDMSIVAPSTADNPKWDARTIPGLNYTLEDGMRNFGPGSPYTAMWSEIGHESNWEMLSSLPLGFVGMVSKVDFDPMPVEKNLKCRIWAHQIYDIMLSDMGFEPITMSWAEIPAALMLGTIDAANGACGSSEFGSFLDVAPHWYLYNEHFAVLPVWINLDRWKSFSSADQAMFNEVGEDWMEEWFAQFEATEDEAFRGFRQQVTVHDLTAEQWSANAELWRKNVWPVYIETVGQDFYDRLVAAAPPLPVTGPGYQPGL